MPCLQLGNVMTFLEGAKQAPGRARLLRNGGKFPRSELTSRTTYKTLRIDRMRSRPTFEQCKVCGIDPGIGSTGECVKAAGAKSEF